MGKGGAIQREPAYGVARERPLGEFLVQNRQRIPTPRRNGELVWFCQFSRKVALIYRTKARAVSFIRSQPTPTTLRDYKVMAERLHKCTGAYHDTWFLRAVVDAEVYATGNSVLLRITGSDTLDQYRCLLPDSCDYLDMLRKHFKSRNLKTVLRKSGYLASGLSPARFSMHLCFVGSLHRIPLHSLRKVRKQHFQKAVRAHLNGPYNGHPAKLFAAAVGFL